MLGTTYLQGHVLSFFAKKNMKVDIFYLVVGGGEYHSPVLYHPYNNTVRLGWVVSWFVVN